MKNLKEKYGEWGIITGASSGLGEEFANQLAAMNFNLVLVARRKYKLEALSDKLTAQYKINTVIIDLDLTQPDFLKYLENKIKNIEIGLLINNAGYAITGHFFDDTLKNQVQLFDLNCKAPLILSHYLGKKMIEKHKGAIINIASASAFLPMPYWSNYAASKAYLLHLTEGFWYELKDNGVDVLAICSSGIKTEFSDKANLKSFDKNVKEVVSQGLKNIGKSPTIIPGFKTKILIGALKFCNRKLLIKIGANAVVRMRAS